MIRTIIESNVFLYALAAAGLLGILCQIMISRRYGQMIREAKGYRKDKTNFMKQLRFDFQTNRKRNNEHANVEVFVRRSMMDYKYLRLRIHQWRRLAAGLYLASVTAAAAAVYYGTRIHIGASHTQNIIWMVAAVTGATLLTWLWTDVPYKASYLQTALEDHLYHSGIMAGYEEAVVEEPQKETVKTPAIIGLRRSKTAGETKAQREKRQLKTSLSKEVAAASEDERREHGRELLRKMDAKEQERIIRDVLAEFLA